MALAVIALWEYEIVTGLLSALGFLYISFDVVSSSTFLNPLLELYEGKYLDCAGAF